MFEILILPCPDDETRLEGVAGHCPAVVFLPPADEMHDLQRVAILHLAGCKFASRRDHSVVLNGNFGWIEFEFANQLGDGDGGCAAAFAIYGQSNHGSDLVSAALLASGGMAVTHIQNVTQRNESDAQNGQNSFLVAMRNGQGGAHECQSGHGNDKGHCHPVAQGTPTDSDACNQCRDQQSPAMDVGRKQEFSADSQARHESNAGNAMQSAEPRKADADTIQSLTNRI